MSVNYSEVENVTTLTHFVPSKNKWHVQKLKGKYTEKNLFDPIPESCLLSDEYVEA